MIISLKCPKCGSAINLDTVGMGPAGIEAHCLTCGYDRVMSISEIVAEQAIAAAARMLGDALRRAIEGLHETASVSPVEFKIGPRRRGRPRKEEGEQKPKRAYHRKIGARKPGRPKKAEEPKGADVFANVPRHRGRPRKQVEAGA
jgi:hypothetical protein